MQKHSFIVCKKEHMEKYETNNCFSVVPHIQICRNENSSMFANSTEMFIREGMYI